MAGAPARMIGLGWKDPGFPVGAPRNERVDRFILIPEEIADSEAYAGRLAASGENRLGVIKLGMARNDL
jgi:hypothetical protein